MVTGNSFIPSTHDPSQGAGQILPVNSGSYWWSKVYHTLSSIGYCILHH